MADVISITGKPINGRPVADDATADIAARRDESMVVMLRTLLADAEKGDLIAIAFTSLRLIPGGEDKDVFYRSLIGADGLEALVSGLALLSYQAVAELSENLEDRLP